MKDPLRKQKQLEKLKLWIRNNPERARGASKRWREKNRQRDRDTNKQWRAQNPEKITGYKLKFRGRYRKTARKWALRNKDKVAATNRRFHQRQKANVHFRIKKRLRNRIWRVLKGIRKDGKFLDILGCSWADFKIYLESKFEVGMSWDNYGSHWHIDHIMPCAIFDLSKPEHQRRCFHFSNLQPLQAAENIRKRATVNSNQFRLL